MGCALMEGRGVDNTMRLGAQPGPAPMTMPRGDHPPALTVSRGEKPIALTLYHAALGAQGRVAKAQA